MTRPAPASAPLRAFFAWLEKNGAATVPLDEFLAALGGGSGAERTLTALAAAGIAREGPPATTLRCGEGLLGCAREVRRAATDRAGSPPGFLAVCGASPGVCETIEVDSDALRQVAVSVADLARLLCDRMGVTEGGRRVRASGGEAVVVGEQPRDDGTARDVVLMVRPRAEGFEDWLEGRARAVRGTLVLLPTARIFAGDAAARHGPGAHVEVDTLADALSIREGALALAPRLRPVRTPPDEADAPVKEAPRTGGVGPARSLPKPKRWQDVRIRMVDGETVSVEVDGRFQRLTHVDFGLAARSNRKPTKAWTLLVMCCEGRGTFLWKTFGRFENARQVVTRLRKALRAVFDVEDDPFHEFNYTDQWRTKFRAEPE